MKDKLNNKYSKSVNIRHSIRTKLVLITIAMVFMIILGGVITNLLFMERYYTSQKADALKHAMELLEEQDFTDLLENADDSESDMEKEKTEGLKQYCEANNLLFLVMDADQNVVLRKKKKKEARADTEATL